MKWLVWVIGVWCIVSSAPLRGQSARPAAPPATETTPDIPGVVAGGTSVQVLQTWEPSLGGEAPISMPDGSLLFSQQDRGRIIKIAGDGTFSTYLETAPNQILGLAYDLKGRLIAAHRGQPNGLVALAPERSVLAESFDGQAFSSPNDLVIDQRGGVYFTDNVSEKTAKSGQSSSGVKPVEAVYYRAASGQVLRVTEVPAKPNGIQLSPDGHVLYVDSGSASFVTAFDVDADGRLSHGRDFAQLSEPGTAGGADGMAIDASGRLYVAANGGVKIFNADGRLMGTIPTSLKPRNLAFAGADRKTLFIVTRGAAYKVVMLSEGVKGRAK